MGEPYIASYVNHVSSHPNTPERLHTPLSLTSFVPETFQLVNKQSMAAGQPKQLEHSLRSKPTQHAKAGANTTMRQSNAS